MADVSEQLLFSALALLTNAVPRDAVRAALTKWAGDPGLELSEILVADGSLDRGRAEALKCLTSAHLHTHNGDLRASIDAWNAHAVTQDLLTEIEQTAPGSTVGMTLPPVLGTTLGADAQNETEIPGVRDLPSFTRDQRFLKLKLHAQGGIGDVYLARDQELQRNVALKEIQQRFVERKDQRHRFLLEAEITGNLEHPGIVPVYSLGRNAAGKPFYAMRFVQGESLAAAIRRFHLERKQAAAKDGDRAGALWGVEFQQLLRRFLDVCDAIEYAHSRNVIHRDLKPGNIMLGQYGETLVVDWGLAKIVGRGDVPSEPAEFQYGQPGEATQAGGALTASIEGNTQPGATIGTPSYMSPEQARGAIEELGPASDVYSLGATLYELLTGVMPFSGKNTAEIIAQVKAGKLKPPRAVLPSVPAPLEAICLKAMAYEPQARYHSARELALDLEHWMADEPVAAHPEKRIEKTARWLRRHRTLTYGFGMGLAGITLAAAVALVMVNGARRNEADARAEAESNFKMAMRAVEDYLTNVSENRLLKQQDTQDLRDLRRDLLKSALPFYEEFVQQHGQDPKLQEQLANAYFRLGRISEEIDSDQPALRYFQAAHGLWDHLASIDLSNLDAQTGLADCDVAIGKLIGKENLPEALEWLKKALGLYQKAVASKPGDPRFKLKLASCCSDIAVRYSNRKEVDTSLSYLETARTILKELVASEPGNLGYKEDLAEIINRIGHAEWVRRQYADALARFTEYQTLCDDILNAYAPGPRPLRIRDMLARSHFNIATIHREQGDDTACLAAMREAVKSWDDLVGVAPSVTSYQLDLADSLTELALTLHRLGRGPAALESVDKALILYDRLIKNDPQNLDHQLRKARALNQKGVLYDEARENAKARETFEDAAKLMREIVQRSKGIEERTVLFCQALENLGEAHVDGGDAAGGLPLYRESLVQRRKLHEAHPTDLSYATSLVNTWILVGNLQRELADPSGALESFTHAEAVVNVALNSHPDERELRGARVGAIERRASALVDLGRTDEAAGLLHRAADLARGGLTSDGESLKCRQALSEVLWDLAGLRRGKDDSAARSLDEERRALWKERPPDDLVNLAAQQAARADLIGYGKTPLSPEGEKIRRFDRDQASANLQFAIERGYKDIGRLKSNPDLAPLLDREEIRRVLETANQPSKRSDR